MRARIAGKQDGPGPIIFGPPRAPRIAKNAFFLLLWPYMKNWWLFSSLDIHRGNDRLLGQDMGVFDELCEIS